MREKLEALRRDDPDITQTQAAKLLGVSRQRVHAYCKQHGIELAGDRPSIVRETVPAGGAMVLASALLEQAWSAYVPLGKAAPFDLVAVSPDGRTVRLITEEKPAPRRKRAAA